ncbi:hypothetical protein H206_02703 [Candidatus Electrothrix aarhusensis]|uniref:Uncharacterized protein n=1 Tax=Candidatus Electrothrix aarhusensis TaxID=1859131 RepID=A0A444IXM7_9BACT|nr:hypothetical protein H206_02703 [Candidatus Electrothrix aarhusensis]
MTGKLRIAILFEEVVIGSNPQEHRTTTQNYHA